MQEFKNDDDCDGGCRKSTMDSSKTPDPPSGTVSTVFLVTGMDCGEEIAAIKNALAHHKISQVEANLMASTVTIRHDSDLSVDLLRQKIESTGVRVAEKKSKDIPLIDRTRLILVGASGLFAGVGFLTETVLKLEWLSILMNVGAVVAGGIIVFPKAWRALRQFHLDMNVLMTVAVIGAFAIGDRTEAATVVFLFSLSELLESYSVTKARRAIREVLDLTPQTASKLLPDGSISTVHVGNVLVGDLLLVRSGDRIPVDGEVESGSSFVNQAPLTGESVPIERSKGEGVFAGTINETGVLHIRVLRAFEDSKVSQVIRLIEDAQKNKAPSERFVSSFARIYTPAVFLLAFLTFLVPPLALDLAWNDWLYRALVLLVIACPCALVISTPVSIVSGLTALARRGVLIKGGTHLEALGKVRAIALDKTGTITEGKPRVQNVYSLNGYSEDEIVQVAASIERLSSHPLAQAVVAFANDKKIPLRTATNFKNVVGRGAEAQISSHEYFLGNHRFVHDMGVCIPELEERLSRLENEALSIVVVGHRPHPGCDGEVLGVLTIGDPIRENARSAVTSLRGLGVRAIVMLSGDNQKTASAIASKVGISETKGDLLPEDKVREVKRLESAYGTIAMIGDGINDAPALAQASVGIAMGAAGTDTALETADVALMKDDLGQVAKAIDLGRRTLSIIKFNISFALTVKFVFLGLAIMGRSNLWLAVAADMGASLIVIANSLRLLRV